ncbi:MAG: lamin tail domain-containing protein [Caldilineaceae bacterium]
MPPVNFISQQKGDQHSTGHNINARWQFRLLLVLSILLTLLLLLISKSHAQSTVSPTETPSETLVLTETVTETPTETATETSIAPSPTVTPLATETPTVTATETATVVSTPMPTATDTTTSTATETSAATFTTAPNLIDTPTETATVTATALDTLTETTTPTPLLPTDTATVTTTPSETPTLLASATSTDTITPLPTETTTPTPTFTETSMPTPLPNVLISEFMVDPQAVSDTVGEWIELVNAGSTAVDLRGWQLTDGISGGEFYTIGVDLVMMPGDYVVLARNGTISANGGVITDVVYSRFTLANPSDAIVLIASNGSEVDRVSWSNGTVAGTSVHITPGKSIERINLAIPALWTLATSPWVGSAGDWGTPGDAYIAPTPTATMTATPTIANSETPTETVTPTPTATPVVGTPTETATFTETSTPTPLPKVLISEFLADPKAVNDTVGEWVELVNAGSSAVDLRGWRITDGKTGGESYTIGVDLVIMPGDYVVLARNGDTSVNGYVVADLVYTGFSLANANDAIVLLAPDGREMERVEWSSGVIAGTSIKITAGKSVERSNLDTPPVWSLATSPWPGSAGDWGTPGSWYTSPTPTATVTVLATSTPTETVPTTPNPQIYISEFLADPKAVSDTNGEWVELYNAETYVVNLHGWSLADLGSEHFTIAVDLMIQPGGYLVLGRNLSPTLNGGVVVDLIYTGFTLANSSDEILLLAPDATEVDRVVWGGDLKVTAGKSLERASFIPAQWVTASAAWPGSFGDFGSPASAYTPIATVTPIATATESPTSTSTTPTPIPQILISEFLADPKAVSDSKGEWVELLNVGEGAVNLRGWRLADRNRDSFTVATDLTVLPGSYVILGRSNVITENGGVLVDLVYTNFTLSNSTDEIVLYAADGSEVDAVAWSSQLLIGQSLKLQAGHSVERTTLTSAATWALGTTAWPGSLGDLGTPHGAYTPVSPTPPATATFIELPTPTLTTGPLPSIFISEFLADPKAVSDSNGEWIELYNAGAAPVNLNGWAITDLGTDHFTITSELMIPAGGYVVLGRNGDPALNGGVQVDLVYSKFSMANSADEILLLAPDGREADRVVWGDTIKPAAGKSLERTSFSGPAQWVNAISAWPGSSGDFGTPSSAYQPPVLTPTPTVGPLPKIYISEFLADPKAVNDSDGEWIELFNASEADVNLNGWTIADLGTDRHTIATDLIIPTGGYLLLGRNGDITVNGGVTLAYTYTHFSMANSADEVLLLAPNNQEVDRVEWGSGLSIVAGKSLERTAFGNDGAWTIATNRWPGSASDWGTPGGSYIVPLPTATPTPTSAVLPSIFISEFLADPKAVSDGLGEWVELYNAGDSPVNLRGWAIADLGTDHYAISSDLIIAAGSYLILGRNNDSSVNGGVVVDEVYAKFTMSNSADEILLLAPDGREVDRVIWGTMLKPKAGISYERSTFDASGQWLLAWQLWPGSSGDLGTPKTRYEPSPLPTATPTASTTATPIDSPWPIGDGNSPLWIEEVNYRGSDAEYIVLYNHSQESVNLSGWLVGDAEQVGDGEGLYRLPADQQLAPGDLFIFARNGLTFREQWGQQADGESDNADDGTPNLEKAKEYAHGSLSLSDSGDEVVLIDPEGMLADAVAFGNGEYALLGLSGSLRTTTGFSLQRVPGADFPTVSDVRHRFMIAPANPLDRQSLPTTTSHDHPQLDNGLMAVWGTLGAQSNFSSAGTVPPHYLLAAANVAGLDFAAIADPEWVAPILLPDGIVSLSAWHWQGSDDSAIVYNQSSLAISDTVAFLNALAAQQGSAQWLTSAAPAAEVIDAFAGDKIDLPADANQLVKQWKASGPLLPAGNSNPPLPSGLNPAPRYTGLLVPSVDPTTLNQAIAAHRGWLTSAAGFWLTLQAEDANGQRHWMGETILSGNVRLAVQVGDRSGQMASVAIWQDNKPLRQLDTPPADGRWSIDLALTPGTVIYAVALQADGDFVVTAPLVVLQGPPPTATPIPPPPPEDHDPALPGGKAPDFESTNGQAGGTPASVAFAKRFGLDVWVEFRARVTVPSGLLDNVIYVADPTEDGVTAGIGIQVYLRKGEFPPLQEGDYVLLRGFLKTFRGEMELQVENPDYLWKIEPLSPLQPLPVNPSQINESLEGRLVTFRGAVTGWQSDSIFLQDLNNPSAEPVRVTIRTTLPWKRPYVKVGEIYEVTGVVSQFAANHPWNGGYRVLVRYQSDLKKVKQ